MQRIAYIFILLHYSIFIFHLDIIRINQTLFEKPELCLLLCCIIKISEIPAEENAQLSFSTSFSKFISKAKLLKVYLNMALLVSGFADSSATESTGSSLVNTSSKELFRIVDKDQYTLRSMKRCEKAHNHSLMDIILSVWTWYQCSRAKLVLSRGAMMPPFYGRAANNAILKDRKAIENSVNILFVKISFWAIPSSPHRWKKSPSSQLQLRQELE